MKKILSLLVVACLLLPCGLAFAADEPFEEGVNYSTPFKGEYGAVPSMLNFGSVKRLAPGESFYDAKTTTISKIRGASLASGMELNTYYCYAKCQFAEAIPAYEINAMLVMATPSREYYATYDTFRLYDMNRKAILSCFFDLTDALERYLDEHDGVFEPGEYTFSLFFNDMSFRVTKLKVS